MNPKFSSLFAVSSEKALTQNDNVSLPNFMMDKTKVNIENLRTTNRKKIEESNPKFESYSMQRIGTAWKNCIKLKVYLIKCKTSNF